MKKQVFKVRRKRSTDKGWVYFDGESGKWVNADGATLYAQRYLADPIVLVARKAYPQDEIEAFVTEIEFEARAKMSATA